MNEYRVTLRSQHGNNIAVIIEAETEEEAKSKGQELIGKPLTQFTHVYSVAAGWRVSSVEPREAA